MEILPRDWPRKHRASVESQFYLQSSDLASISPYTGQATVFDPHVQAFICKLTFPQKKGPDWRELSGFLSSLRGRRGLIRMVDYHRMRPGYDVAVDSTVETWDDGTTWDDGRGWESGFLPPTCIIGEAASRGDRSVVLHSLPANIMRVLRSGDLWCAEPNGLKPAHAHCYEITYDSQTDAQGRTRIEFEPGLRAGLAVGDTSRIRYPYSVFRLLSNQEGVINRIAPGNFGALGLSLVEHTP